MSNSVSFKLTPADIARYERQIAEFDLSLEDELLKKIPGKVQTLLKSPDLSPIQASLVQDVFRLLLVLRNVPDLSLEVRRKILFALNYFYNPDDEIPDAVTGLGFLDDAIVVKWIVEQVFGEFPEFYRA